MSLANILELAISSLIVVGITTSLVVLRKVMALPRDMVIIKAAVFRLLRSNKVQGVALTTIAECQKAGKCNGDTGIAVEAVKRDQEATDIFLTAAALGETGKIEEELKP